MKVLLVAPAFGQRLGHYYTFPLGLAYISSALKHAGHDVTCINLNHRQDPMKAFVESLQIVAPDIVGTGGLSPHYPLLRNILATSKSVCPTAITMVGGGAVSSEPELLLKSTKADIGVIGEGEITTVELLQSLETGQSLSEVEGLIYKTDNAQLNKTPSRTAIEDLDTIPWPDYDGFEVGILLDSYKTSDAYHLNFSDTPRTLDLISSRSCPYSCTFCFHPLGKKYRERSLDNFFAELDYVVQKYRVNQLSIMDELFATNHEKLIDFCRRIKPYNIAWTVQLHVSIVDEDILHLMRDAGCTYISYGIESMNDQVLSSMHKRTLRSSTQKALQMTYDADIGIQGNLIFGDPAETLETAKDSLTWWSNNRHFQINCIGLGYYPGSKIYETAVDRGVIQDKVSYHQASCPPINATAMSNEQLDILRLIVDLCLRTFFIPARNVEFEEQSTSDSQRGKLLTIRWTCVHCGATNLFKNVPTNSHFGDQCATIRISCRSCNHRNDIPINSFAKQYPSSVENAAGLAIKYLNTGDNESALAKLKSNYQSAPDHPMTNYLFGRIFCESGDNNNAIKFMRNALLGNPYIPMFFDGMAQVLSVSSYMQYANIFSKQSRLLQEWTKGGRLADFNFR
jgi:anaerobic magnesium-protoporphyrin IX monomethyl ester cyclase